MQLVGAVMIQERADEGKFPVFMMWSRARSGHRNLYTHLQDTYITSSVVSEGR